MMCLLHMKSRVFLPSTSPANKKLTPKKYEGGRELNDFISYLQREATNPPIIQEEKPKKKKKAQEDL